MSSHAHAVPAVVATFTPVRNGLLQRSCACGGSAAVTGECEECGKKRLSRQYSTDHSQLTARDSEGIPPIVDEVLRSPGQPLDAETRAFMEPRFGHNFSHVRIHAHGAAAESARAVNALAYTVGNHVVFGTGNYAPHSDPGRELIAHELTHTIQQSKGGSGEHGISQPTDISEREASQAAHSVMMAGPGRLPVSAPAYGKAQSRSLDRALDADDSASGIENAIPQAGPGSSDRPVRLQRAADNGSTEPQADANPREASAQPEAAASLIVEDDAERLAAGQMRKGDFLSAVGQAVSPILPPAQVEHFNQKLEFYRSQNTPRLEGDIHNYAPETTSATAASEYVAAIRERVQRAFPDGQNAGTAAGSTAADGANAASESPAFKKSEGASSPPTLSGSDRAESIRGQLSSGQSLDGGTRSRMESAFGYNFSSVRLHTDSQAAHLSSGFGARAFTLGSDIGFNAGEYQPGTLIGDALLAHELAHVVQQGGGSGSSALMQESGGYENLEEDADHSAIGAMISLWGGAKSALSGIARKVMPNLRSGLRLQRCNGGPHVTTQYRFIAFSGFDVCIYCACTAGAPEDKVLSHGPQKPCPPGREVEWNGHSVVREVQLNTAPCANSYPGAKCQ